MADQSTAEKVADFFLGFLPDLLPLPADKAIGAAVDAFRGPFDELLKQPRLRKQLLDAASEAEKNFRTDARKLGKAESIVQAVAMLPVSDNERFQATLAKLPEHLNEDFVADDLTKAIEKNWKGMVTPKELREGVAIYLNSLRVQLLKVDEFAELITRLATLRTAHQSDQILAIVKELAGMVKVLLGRMTAPAPQQLVYSLFTVPLPVADFTGRKDKLDKLVAEFSRGVLITGISGGGGIGKTQLARKLVAEIGSNYPDARMEINLLGTSKTPLAVEEAMRRVLEPFYPGAKLPDEPEHLRGLYQQTFTRKKALLLLDNAASSEQVKQLIPPAPSAAIVTSRHNFSLSEQGLKEPVRLDVLSYDEARTLLRNSAPKLEKASDKEIDELSKVCGLLPLALRVSASLLNQRPDWTLRIICGRLKDERTRLERLKSGEDLERDVKVVIGLSYEQLDEEMQKQLRALAVFAAPFWKVSAAAVWGVDEEHADVALGALFGRSLVNVDLPASDEIVAVYSLHDLTRFYLTEKLLENKDECEYALEQYSIHYLLLARRADDEYLQGGDHLLNGLVLFRSIWPQVNAVWERCAAREENQWPRLKSADLWLTDFAGCCPNVLNLHVSPQTQIPIMASTLGAAQRLGDRKAEGIALGNLGGAYFSLGDFKTAIELQEKRLEFAREVGDRSSEGAALSNLATNYSALGKVNKAIEFLERALLIFRELGDHRAEGKVLANLGVVYEEIGEAKKAIESCEQSLMIARKLGDLEREGVALHGLGVVNLALGNLEVAVEFFQQQLQIVREIGDRRGEATALGAIGINYGTLGDTNKSLQYFEEELNIEREIGDRRGEATTLGNIGIAYKKLGDLKKAIEIYEQALVLAQTIGDRREEGTIFSNLSVAYSSLGESNKAIEFSENALEIAIETSDRRGQSNLFSNLGTLYFSKGDLTKALTFYEKALIIDRETGYRRDEEKVLGYIGSTYVALGDNKKSIETYEQYLLIVREIGDRHDEGSILRKLGNAYVTLGDKKKAIEIFEQYLLVARETGDRHGEGWALGSLGLLVDEALGDTKRAIEFYEQALTIDREFDDRKAEGADLGGLGYIYKNLGDIDKAQVLIKEAIEIFDTYELPFANVMRGWLKELDQGK